MELLLEIVLVGLLGATLFHAIRLERALGVLKRDRAALEDLIAGFNDSTRQAEAGIDRLRAAADGAGRQIARQLDEARTLKDDLAFLSDRGARLADRIDALVRAGRSLATEPARPAIAAEATRTLTADAARPNPTDVDPDDGASLRSQAERDLLRALRMAR